MVQCLHYTGSDQIACVLYVNDTLVRRAGEMLMCASNNIKLLLLLLETFVRFILWRAGSGPNPTGNQVKAVKEMF